MNLTGEQWRLIEPILPSQAGKLLRHTLPVSFGRNDLLAQFKHIIYNVFSSFNLSPPISLFTRQTAAQKIVGLRDAVGYNH